MKQWPREQLGDILRNNKKIAVVGLSDKPMRTSYMISEAMQQAGYTIYPVNPTIKSSLGVTAVASLQDLPEEVDIINVFRQPAFLKDLLEEILSLSYKPIIWTQLGVINEDFERILTDKGFTVVMDRCIKVEHSMMKK